MSLDGKDLHTEKLFSPEGTSQSALPSPWPVQGGPRVPDSPAKAVAATSLKLLFAEQQRCGLVLSIMYLFEAQLTRQARRFLNYFFDQLDYEPLEQFCLVQSPSPAFPLKRFCLSEGGCLLRHFRSLCNKRRRAWSAGAQSFSRGLASRASSRKR